MTDYTVGNITFGLPRVTSIPCPVVAALTSTWPTNDREWARAHVGCNVTTCPNGKCRATGECVDQVVARNHGEISERHTPAPPLELESPPLAPTIELPELLPDQVAVRTRFSMERLSWSGRPKQWEDGPDGPRRAAPRTIIAFTGLAGAGKSTAAAHLVKHRGFQRVRFAGPLKAMMAALGLSSEEVDGSLKETPCDLLCGKTPRQVMQWLGTELGRDLIGPDLWIRAWEAALAKVPAGVPVVVDDCRFPNEAAAVLANGGILVRVERPGAGTASVHASEQHALPATATLHNTLDERNLREQVDVLLRDLSHAAGAAS